MIEAEHTAERLPSPPLGLQLPDVLGEGFTY